MSWRRVPRLCELGQPRALSSLASHGLAALRRVWYLLGLSSQRSGMKMAGGLFRVTSRGLAHLILFPLKVGKAVHVVPASPRGLLLDATQIVFIKTV